MRSDLVELIVGRAIEALTGLPRDERAETYVVSFWVNDEEDDPRRPVLRVGTNTETKVSASTPSSGSPPGWPVASDAAEARWNFAFWVQNDLAVVGGVEDPDGRARVDALFTELGLTWADGDYSTAAYEVRRRMSAEFVGACLAAARRLHEGVLPRLFDRDIPVIVHELEYYDEIARQNLACNEPALVWEFVRWVSPRGFEADSLDGR